MTVSPTSLTVTQNQTATFYCSADGNPKPSVSWSKISGTGLVNTDGQDNKLQIKSAGSNDTGNYVCTATNVLGQAKRVVKLFVEGMLLEIEFNPRSYKEGQHPPQPLPPTHSGTKREERSNEASPLVFVLFRNNLKHLFSG